MAITILVTGFGPFPGAPRNPTAALVDRLVRTRRAAFADVRLIGHVFPTTYAAVDEQLPLLLAAHHPHVLLMFGLAARTPYLRIETRARNVGSAIFPDAAGRRLAGGAITAGAAPVRRGRAPFARLLTVLREVHVPARTSREAGRYLCNYLYWRGLESAAAGGPGLVAFVHVPMPRRARQRRGAPPRVSDVALARAGERLLGALLAAGRRQRLGCVRAGQKATGNRCSAYSAHRAGTLNSAE